MSIGHVLDSSLVEDLHQLTISRFAQDRINATVSEISELTLTGLVEYGCLRWLFPQLPKLPAALMDHGMGKAITEASSVEHRRAIDLGKSDEAFAPRESEFVMYLTAKDLLSERVQFFCIRFARSAQHAGFSNSVSHCLQAGLHEMMDNAVRHSAASVRIVAGYRIRPELAEFVVADVGQGVLASMRRCSRYSYLTSHSEAIRLALHDGVTSNERQIGGRGFNDIFKALTLQWGLLRFRSGEGCVTIDGRGPDADAGIITFPPALPGFQVSVSCQAPHSN